MSVAFLPLIVLALGVAGAEPTPAATPEIEEAKSYFEAGRQAYEAGDFATAATAFEEAQRRAPRPAIAFSMAQAYRQQWFLDRDPAKLQRAIELYGQYLREAPKGARRSDASQHLQDLQAQAAQLGPKVRIEGSGLRAKTQLMISSRTPGATASIDGAESSEVPLIADVDAGKHTVVVEALGHVTSEVTAVAVEGRLVVAEVNLKEKPGIIRVSAPDGCDVTIDGRPVGTTPILFPIEISAGEHFVAVTERGAHPHLETVRVGRGEEVVVVASLISTTQRDVSYWFLGGGAVFFAATAVTVAVALGSEGEARVLERKLSVDQKNLTVAERDRYNQLRNKRADMITASSLLLAGTVATGLTGGLLYFVDTPSVQARRVQAPAPAEPAGERIGAVVLPVVLDDGAGLSFAMAF